MKPSPPSATTTWAEAWRSQPAVALAPAARRRPSLPPDRWRRRASRSISPVTHGRELTCEVSLDGARQRTGLRAAAASRSVKAAPDALTTEPSASPGCTVGQPGAPEPGRVGKGAPVDAPRPRRRAPDAPDVSAADGGGDHRSRRRAAEDRQRQLRTGRAAPPAGSSPGIRGGAGRKPCSFSTRRPSISSRSIAVARVSRRRTTALRRRRPATASAGRSSNRLAKRRAQGPRRRRPYNSRSPVRGPVRGVAPGGHAARPMRRAAVHQPGCRAESRGGIGRARLEARAVSTMPLCVRGDARLRQPWR